MSKETRAMWREYNRGFPDTYAQDQRSEHEIILDEMGESPEEKYGDSGISEIR